jgi:hypothetical protein
MLKQAMVPIDPTLRPSAVFAPKACPASSMTTSPCSFAIENLIDGADTPRIMDGNNRFGAGGDRRFDQIGICVQVWTDIDKNWRLAVFPIDRIVVLAPSPRLPQIVDIKTFSKASMCNFSLKIKNALK